MNIKRNHLLKALIIYGALAFSFFFVVRSNAETNYTRDYMIQPGYRYYNRRGYDYGYSYGNGRYLGYYNP